MSSVKSHRTDKRGRPLYRKMFELSDIDLDLLTKARAKFSTSNDTETIRRLLREVQRDEQTNE